MGLRKSWGLWGFGFREVFWGFAASCGRKVQGLSLAQGAEQSPVRSEVGVLCLGLRAQASTLILNPPKTPPKPPQNLKGLRLRAFAFWGFDDAAKRPEYFIGSRLRALGKTEISGVGLQQKRRLRP